MGAAVGLLLLTRAIGEVHGEARCGSLQLPHAFDMPSMGAVKGGSGQVGAGAFQRVKSEDKV